MVKLVWLAASTVLIGAALPVQAPESPKPDFGGRLYRAVFMSGPGTLAASDVASTAEPLRARLSTFLARRSSFASGYESKPEDADAVARDAKRRDIERAIVSTVEAPDIGSQAVEFVSSAPIAHEWQGRPEGPAAEAAYAEGVLKKAPATPLAPFLYVFIAQRQRAAFEAANRSKDLEAMKTAARKYRAFLERARSASDPLFRLIADDLDRVAYVYTRSDKHPRDFNPDG